MTNIKKSCFKLIKSTSRIQVKYLPLCQESVKRDEKNKSSQAARKQRDIIRNELKLQPIFTITRLI